VLVAAALALWWMRARRAEAPAPPAISTGGDTEEITPPEKQELDRVLRERSGAPAR